MRKAIFIILTLAGFASGAEMEATDRLSVDGSSLFKSTAVFSGSVGIGTSSLSGSQLAVIGSPDKAYSLAVGTSTNYSLTVSTGGTVGIAEEIKIGSSTLACNSANAGSIRYSGTHFYGCDSSEWRQLDNPLPPSVTVVAPSSGLITGGTPITVTGTGFTAPATVFVGGNEAVEVSVLSSTRITAATPPSATTGAKDVKVQNPDGQYNILPNAFTYTPLPSISSVNPVRGPFSGGSTITIAGSNFAAGATVFIANAQSSSVTVVSASTITAVVPAGASLGAKDLQVTNPDGGAGTLAGGFTYVADGSQQSMALLSCKSFIDNGGSRGDGIYWIDPDGGSIANAFQAYCDMTTDGGGWTFFAFIDMHITGSTVFSSDGGTYRADRGYSESSYGKGASILPYISHTQMMFTLDSSDPATAKAANKFVVYQYPVGNFGFNSGPTPCSGLSSYSYRLDLIGSFTSGTAYNCTGTYWGPGNSSGTMQLYVFNGSNDNGVKWGSGMNGDNSWNHYAYCYAR